MPDLAVLDATAQAELVRRRELTPAELVDAAIARLERLNPQLNAVIHPALDRARAAATSPNLPDGPFRGVPFLMKDIGGAEAGQPYHAGMRFLKDAGWKETLDAYLTLRFRGAGLISLGRTSTPELALLPTTEPAAYGATRNPWNLAHSAGGSSGGSASAVAAGIVPAAHASDGGGSIRGPASMCGLVGLKPTRGRCSFGPGLGERWSGFSAEFVVTRSVRDTAALLDVAAGPMPGDPYFAPPPAQPFATTARIAPGKLRIGVLHGGPRGLPLHEECAAAVQNAATLLRDLGHEVTDEYPDALDDHEHVMAYVGVVAANVARALDSWGQKVGRPIGPDDVEYLTWTMADRGRAITAAEHLANLEYVHGFGRRLAAWWEGGYDLLVTATQAATPPEIGELTSTADEPLRALMLSAPYGACTLPFNLSGQPAVSLPLHWTKDGLPIGVQLIAPYAREDLLLQASTQLEQAAPWSRRKPPIHG
ncbi:MAG TPA: amidase [Candidatus Binatia bacterium]|jgi:amidase|nr:amidase [Candidatus Binatia bacterium]